MMDLAAIDKQAFQYLNNLDFGSAEVAKYIKLGDEYGLYIFAGIAAVFFVLNRPAFWTAVAAAVLARGVLTEGIRYFYHRLRPFDNSQLENVRKLIEKSASEGSFPSGHAAFYFAIAFAVYFFDRRLGQLALFLAVVLSLARVYLGVHYPSDILGGAILGLVSAFAASRLFNRYGN